MSLTREPTKQLVIRMVYYIAKPLPLPGQRTVPPTEVGVCGAGMEERQFVWTRPGVKVDKRIREHGSGVY